MSFQAIDVWMGACTAFIFAALIEFTCVNYLWRQDRLAYNLSEMHKGKRFNNLGDEDEDDQLEDEDEVEDEQQINRNKKENGQKIKINKVS